MKLKMKVVSQLMIDMLYLYIPEPERVESMKYEFDQYGSDLATGQLELKMGYNLDRKAIKEGGKFEFERLSIVCIFTRFSREL